MSKLQEIKGKVLVRHVFIQPYQMSDDGREDFEEDVQWLISEVEKLTIYKNSATKELERLRAEIHDIQIKTSKYIGEESIDRQNEMSRWQTALTKSQQKAERLDKVMKENLTPATYYVIQQLALESEGSK
ncbi:MAG: hypothetical protein ACQET8_23045 [Bacillota bacterium]